MSSTPANTPDPALAALTDELRAALAPGIQLLHPLGAGGMGHVFLGRDPLLKRQVAIKVLSPDLAHDDTARARFVREAESSANVGHPNVVGIHLVGELPGSRTPYFVMQFIEGRTLGDELESGAAMMESRARRIVGEVAAALAAAHGRGLVHRDIKPANIMVEAESDRAVVLDFGISAVLDRGAKAAPGAKLTQAGTYLGTPTYMSPEQATGEEITEKSDVYSLGCVAFEMLTGKPPFQGQTLMVMAAHVKDQPPALGAARPGIDAHLAQVVDRCLAKDPAARPTAAEVAQSLLPQAQSLVEWPPPGLESLRGAGARLAIPWTMLTAMILLLFVVLANQPTLASPAWTAGERSAVWSGLVSINSQVRSERQTGLATQDASPIWLFVVATTWLSLLGATIVVGTRTERLIARAIAAMRAGYPRRVVMDAAWDDTRELGALLNASGRFALMTAATRAEILRLRRLRALLTPSVLAGTMLVSLLWILGVLGRDPSGSFVSLGDLVVVSVPAILGVVGAAWIGTRVQALGGVQKRWFQREALVMPEASVVSSWLEAAGITHTPAVGRRATMVRWLGRLSASAALLVALFGMFLVSWAAFIPAAKMSQSKVDARRWMEAQQNDSTRSMPWGTFDSILARAAVPQSATLDLEAGHLLLGRGLTLRALRVENRGAFAADTAGARRLNGPPDSVDINVVRRGLMDTEAGVAVSAEQLRAAALIASSAWLPVWRRFARSAPYPALWTYREGLPGIEDLFDLPILPYDAVNGVAVANRAAAFVALRRGNAAEAELRARENIGAARQLMRNGFVFDEAMGRRMVLDAAALLRIIGKQTRSERLTAETSALEAAVQRWQAERIRDGTWTALFADPVNPKALEYLNSDRSPGQFMYAYWTAGAAVCLNAREIIFGVHPARYEVHQKIAEAWGAPRAAEIARLADNTVLRTFRGELPDMPAVLKPLQWTGLLPLASRLLLCSVWLG